MIQYNKKQIIISLLFFLISIGVIIGTYYAISENIFFMKRFNERIISLSTARGVDIENTIKIYMTGIFISAFFLFKSFFPLLHNNSFKFGKYGTIRKKFIYIRSKEFIKNRYLKIITMILIALSGLISAWISLNIFLFIFIVFIELAIYKTINYAEIYFLNITIKRFAFYFSLVYSFFSIASHFSSAGSIFIIYRYFFVFSLSFLCSFSKIKPSVYSSVLAVPALYWVITEICYNNKITPDVLLWIKIVLLIVSLFLCFLKIKVVNKSGDMHNIVFLISLVCICNMHNYYYEYIPDYFESANHSVSLSSIIKYGELPVFETFDAHMLKNQLDGFLYLSLGGNIDEAALAPYIGMSSLLICLIGGYLSLRIFVSENSALFLSLFLPLNYRGLDFVPFVLVAAYKIMQTENSECIKQQRKKDKVTTDCFKTYMLYCILLIGSVLYSLDTGVAAVVSSVGVMLLFYLITKNKRGVLRFIVSIFLTVFLGLVITSLICYLKNIQFKEWFTHFLKITIGSNQNWAYGMLGRSDSEIVKHYYLYTVLILSVFISLLYYILKNQNDNKTFTMLLLLLGFGIVWISNIPRTFVRHNLMEKTSSELFNTAFLFLVMCTLYFGVRKTNTIQKLYLVLIFLSMCPYDSLLRHNMVFNPSDSINKTCSEVSEKYSRAKYDTNKVDSFCEVMDIILNQDETFFDFSNNTLLYTLAVRDNPIYENQSPGLISGETVQKMTIEQLERNKEKIVCAVLPRADQKSGYYAALDGIQNEDRYYLISEYLYNNYVPLVRFDEFDVWIQKSKINDKCEQIEMLRMCNNVDMISEEWNCTDENHYLGEIPYIWASYDEYKPSDRVILREIAPENGMYKVDISDVRNILKGNYLMIEACSDINCTINLKLDYCLSIDNYSFNVHKGNHFYLFRISNDYKWYYLNNCFISFDDSIFNPGSVYICVGDTLD